MKAWKPKKIFGENVRESERKRERKKEKKKN